VSSRLSARRDRQDEQDEPDVGVLFIPCILFILSNKNGAGGSIFGPSSVYIPDRLDEPRSAWYCVE
jgi:hypothetical protein